MGIVDCAAAWPKEVSFGCGSTFVLCPSDVVVEEFVVGGSFSTVELASLDRLMALSLKVLGMGTGGGREILVAMVEVSGGSAAYCGRVE